MITRRIKDRVQLMVGLDMDPWELMYQGVDENEQASCRVVEKKQKQESKIRRNDICPKMEELCFVQ